MNKYIYKPCFDFDLPVCIWMCVTCFVVPLVLALIGNALKFEYVPYVCASILSVIPFWLIRSIYYFVIVIKKGETVIGTITGHTEARYTYVDSGSADDFKEIIGFDGGIVEYWCPVLFRHKVGTKYRLRVACNHFIMLGKVKDKDTT